MNFKSEHLNLEACLFWNCPYLTIKSKFRPFRIIKTLKYICKDCEKGRPSYDTQLHYQRIYKDCFGGK